MISWAAHAQESSVTVEDVTEQAELVSKAAKRIIVPVPLSNPAFGTGGALAVVKVYEPKNAGAPWTTGIGAFYTSKGNKALAGFHKMSLDNDHLRFTFLGSYASLDQAFYGIGADAGDRNMPFGIEQTTIVARAQGLVEVSPHLYVGAQLQFMDIHTKPKLVATPLSAVEIPDHDIKNTIIVVGPTIQYDTRDSGFYPTRGLFIQSQFLESIKALGSSFNYYKLRFSANKYKSIGPGGVIAVRFSLCGAGKNAPFYDLCNYGQSSDLRGYEGGRYRDRAIWAMQAEIRQRIKGRIGGVLFAGIGGISPGLANLDESNFLPSAGAGVRFELSKDYHINARLDAAVGKHSNGIYLSLGEAF